MCSAPFWSATTIAVPSGVFIWSLKKVSHSLMGTPSIEVCSPQMLGCIGAPWAPGFRTFEQRLRRKGGAVRDHRAAQQRRIGGGECIAVAQRAQRPILHRSAPETSNPAQPCADLLTRSGGLKQLLVRVGDPCEGSQGLQARRRQTQSRKISRQELRGCRKDVGQRLMAGDVERRTSA